MGAIDRRLAALETRTEAEPADADLTPRDLARQIAFVLMRGLADDAAPADLAAGQRLARLLAGNRPNTD